MSKQDEFYRTQIRIPSEVYGAIKDATEESGRSINAEIIELLLIGLGEKEPPLTATSMRAIFREEFKRANK